MTTRRPGGGRKPTPNVIKFKTGNPGKGPLKTEPTPIDTSLPSPPCHLDAYGVEEWSRIASGLHAMGVLYSIDQQALAAYCSAYSRWRHAEEVLQDRVKQAKGNQLAALIDKTSNGNVIQNPLIGIANKAAGDMVRFAAEFGLTPAARARLAIDPNKSKGGKFAGLIGADSGQR